MERSGLSWEREAPGVTHRILCTDSGGDRVCGSAGSGIPICRGALCVKELREDRTRPPKAVCGEWPPWAARAARAGARAHDTSSGHCPLRERARPAPFPPRAPRRAGWTGRRGPRTPPPRAGTPGRARPAPRPRPPGARTGSRSRSRWQRRRRRGLFLLSLRPEEPREPGPCPRAGRRRRLLPSARVSAAPPLAPIFRRSSVTRRRRRRRGPEREAPGTGARRPPPPPWRRWDPVRSALGPGPESGPGTGGWAGGAVALRRPIGSRVPGFRPSGPGEEGNPCPTAQGVGS